MSATPVSYTHLDVYKRQTLDNPGVTFLCLIYQYHLPQYGVFADALGNRLIKPTFNLHKIWKHTC